MRVGAATRLQKNRDTPAPRLCSATGGSGAEDEAHRLPGALLPHMSTELKGSAWC